MNHCILYEKQSPHLSERDSNEVEPGAFKDLDALQVSLPSRAWRTLHYNGRGWRAPQVIKPQRFVTRAVHDTLQEDMATAERQTYIQRWV
jgi:hypothetical protein